jgi:hypothetical protein
VLASQTRAVSSSLAVTMRVPSRLYSACQTRAVPSPLAVTMRVPSGLYQCQSQRQEIRQARPETVVQC